MPRAILIYNPAAGRFPASRLAEMAVQSLQELGWTVTHRRSNHPGHVTSLARLAVEEDMDALFVAGGDGSIGKAVAGLVGSKTALGVIPSGTSNVWARELGLSGLSWSHPRALETSARMLAASEVKSVDVGMCNQVPFLLWAGLGLDAIVVQQLETHRKRWKKNLVITQYAASLLRNSLTWSGLPLTIQATSPAGIGIEIEGRFSLAVATNIRHYAGGFSCLSPQARLDDGFMDLWLFSGTGVKNTLTHAWNLVSGRHLVDARILPIPFRDLLIKIQTPTWVQTDGEPQRIENRMEIKVLRQALRVMVPPTTNPALFSP